MMLCCGNSTNHDPDDIEDEYQSFSKYKVNKMDGVKTRKQSKISSTETSSIGSKRSAKGKAPKPPTTLAQKTSDGSSSTENPYSTSPKVSRGHNSVDHYSSSGLAREALANDDKQRIDVIPLYPVAKNTPRVDRSQKLLEDAKRALKSKPPLPPTPSKNSISSKISAVSNNNTQEPKDDKNDNANKFSDNLSISDDIYKVSLGQRPDDFSTNLATSLSNANVSNGLSSTSINKSADNKEKDVNNETKNHNSNVKEETKEALNKNVISEVKKIPPPRKFSGTSLVKIDSSKSNTQDTISFGSTKSIKDRLSKVSDQVTTAKPVSRTTSMADEISTGSSKNLKNIWKEKEEENNKSNKKSIEETKSIRKSSSTSSTPSSKSSQNQKSQRSGQNSSSDRAARLLEEAKKDIQSKSTIRIYQLHEPSPEPTKEQHKKNNIISKSASLTPEFSLTKADRDKNSPKVAIVNALYGEADDSPVENSEPAQKFSSLPTLKQSSKSSLINSSNTISPLKSNKTKNHSTEISKPQNNVHSKQNEYLVDQKSILTTKPNISTQPSNLTQTKPDPEKSTSLNEESKTGTKPKSISKVKPPLDRKVSFEQKPSRVQTKPPSLPTVSSFHVLSEIISTLFKLLRKFLW